MNGNFNKEGKEYGFHARGPARHDYGMLKDHASQLFENIIKQANHEYNEADPKRKSILKGIMACGDRLEGFLFQSTRIASLSMNINKIIPEKMNSAEMFLNAEQQVDFESFLFHGRAALDRLALFVSSSVYGQNTYRFSRLANVLSNFKEDDERANRSIDIVETSYKKLSGVIIEGDNNRSLRSVLIHRKSTPEIVDCYFTVHRFSDGTILRFDAEIDKFPIIGTARMISQYICYVILNLLELYIGQNKFLPPEDCEPIWENRLLYFSEYIDDTMQGPKISVIKGTPDGFIILNYPTELKEKN